MEGNHSNEVTIVVSRKIKPGYEKEYDDWLRRYLAVESKASGYLGTTIIVQGGTNSAVRYIIPDIPTRLSCGNGKIHNNLSSY